MSDRDDVIKKIVDNIGRNTYNIARITKILDQYNKRIEDLDTKVTNMEQHHEQDH